VPVPLPDLLIALVVTVLSVAVQGAIGFGMSIFAVPLLSLVNPLLAPVPQLVIAVPMTLTMLLRERHAFDLRGFGWVISGRLAGTFAGLWLLVIATQRSLSLMIALIVLFAVAIVASGISLPRTPATSLAAGTVSGIAGIVAALGGPPVALLYRNERGPLVRSSLGAVLGFGTAVALITRAAGGKVLWAEIQVGLLLMPAMALGLWLSGRFLSRMDGEVLRRSILVLAALAAAALLARTLLG
jgi:uncharacterized membrane protein YfcA